MADISPDIERAILRDREVMEAIRARKGNEYALKVSMFVACSKMHAEVFAGCTYDVFESFTSNLLICFGVKECDFAEFLGEAQSIRKPQQL